MTNTQITTERPILFGEAMVAAIIDGRKRQSRRIIKEQPVLEGVESFGPSWKWRKGGDWFSGVTTEQLVGRTGLLHTSRCPFHVGMRLWVRETFYQCGHWESVPGVKTKTGRMKWRFVADSLEIRFVAPPEFRKGRHAKDPQTVAWHKRLARFMPRKASRLTLEITAVRVERLQDISEADILAEGVRVPYEKVDGGFKQLVRLTGKFLPSDYLPCKPQKATESQWLKAHFVSLWESINGEGAWVLNPWVWIVEFKRVEQKALKP